MLNVVTTVIKGRSEWTAWEDFGSQLELVVVIWLVFKPPEIFNLECFERVVRSSRQVDPGGE
jgi:hypothetical protein